MFQPPEPPGSATASDAWAFWLLKHNTFYIGGNWSNRIIHYIKILTNDSPYYATDKCTCTWHLYYFETDAIEKESRKGEINISDTKRIKEKSSQTVTITSVSFLKLINSIKLTSLFAYCWQYSRIRHNHKN